MLKVGPKKPLITISAAGTPQEAKRRTEPLFGNVSTMSMEEVQKQISEVIKREIPIPPELKNIIDKTKQNLKDEVNLIREKYKQIRKEEQAVEQMAAGGAVAFGGGVGAPTKPSAAGQVGFVGIREAWKRMAESLTVKKSPEVVELKRANELNKQMLETEKKQLQETQGLRREIKGVGTVDR